MLAVEVGCPVGKLVEQPFKGGAVCSEMVAMHGAVLDQDAIALEVNGQTQPSSDVNKLIWNIREIIADLSTDLPPAAG